MKRLDALNAVARPCMDGAVTAVACMPSTSCETTSVSTEMARPIALNTALATAAGAGTLLDSPMLLAPNGPRPSSDSMKMTSMSGASRWVATRAP